MNRLSSASNKADKDCTPSPTKGHTDLNLNDQKDLSLQYPASRLSTERPTFLLPTRPSSGAPTFSTASQKQQPGVPSISPIQHPHSYGVFEKPNDPVLWASRLELRDKAHFALQEFSTLAKEASSSHDVSEDILRVAKAFSQLEGNIKNTTNILSRMKASVADVHQSLKTLPSIADGLAIDDLVKPPASAPNTNCKLPPY